MITASTKSNEPVHQAAQMCRKRGRIVLVGVTGLELVAGRFLREGAELPGLVLLWAGPLRPEL
jgi:threonine dehydrogenase-like Zn-dependent dehydrogenase